jgi:hypothetical protein
MAGTGEPYSVVARMLGSDDPAGDVAAIAEVLARLGSTLAAPLSGKTSLETKTLELWDFGVPAGSLDWTRFPEPPG